LLVAVSPFSVRAPAMAAQSAAFWHWARATAMTPRSMARATKPKRASKLMTTSGSTAPDVRVVRMQLVMGLSPNHSVQVLASDEPHRAILRWAVGRVGVPASAGSAARLKPELQPG